MIVDAGFLAEFYTRVEWVALANDVYPQDAPHFHHLAPKCLQWPQMLAR
jgi:hypothetical protein